MLITIKGTIKRLAVRKILTTTNDFVIVVVKKILVQTNAPATVIV